MAWGKCDDGFWRHLKTLGIQERFRGQSIALFWLSISWSNDVLADGSVTMATVRMLGFTRAAADELVRVGLYDGDAKAGYRIHDYFTFNKSKLQILAERKRWADEKAEQRRLGNMSAPDSTADISPTNAVVRPGLHGGQMALDPTLSTADSRIGAREGASRTPVTPVEILQEESLSPDVARVRARVRESGHEWPTKKGDGFVAMVDKFISQHGVDAVIAAVGRLDTQPDFRALVFALRDQLNAPKRPGRQAPAEAAAARPAVLTPDPFTQAPKPYVGPADKLAAERGLTPAELDAQMYAGRNGRA